MTPSLSVCNGCCCGRVEKGHNEVPIDFLKKSWEENNLSEYVKLSITGCLGPCSKHNVTLLTTKEGRIWLGELQGQSHYEAIVEWARNISQDGKDAELPEILTSQRFVPEKSKTIHSSIL